jgi:hypothetical protein
MACTISTSFLNLSPSFKYRVITDGLLRRTGDLAEKYLLRGFDSIHLASAMHLKDRTRSEVYFSSPDRRLNESAGKEGLILLWQESSLR